MLINWFTVIAQVINFLILVWLLKRFLYKPILKAIDDREKQIAAQIEDAEAKKVAAAKDAEEFQKKNKAFVEQRNENWNKALDEIKTERQRLMDEARKDSSALRAKLDETLQIEQRDMGLTITRKTQQEVFAIARKALKELADNTLEQQMGNVFIKRLKSLSPEEKKQLTTAFLSSKEPIAIKSTFNLIPQQQTEIENAIKELLGNLIQFTFNTSPELISGIELNANGYKLSWSISDYLNSLEKIIAETINAKSKVNKNEKEAVAEKV
jgi:F-type H+-transporting ATPase subunit b